MSLGSGGDYTPAGLCRGHFSDPQNMLQGEVCPFSPKASLVRAFAACLPPAFQDGVLQAAGEIIFAC
ncbi:hypothetical protein DCCM_0117 [Desulfocucumis palustris]|uniref:Uncharacterized protein n=1 Tax=Desulfocucumis palustris TaxID=1898651 RepID=A0A2L2X8N0_9FIRM|nr:hypothetical protein DCCM_0117 [Desulfocucumis palustris]